ncbi:MAG: hypothetical protein GX952_02320 [Firmicutes bacterium]|nr:hypothetical protein [Bacillota bacterium]
MFAVEVLKTGFVAGLRSVLSIALVLFPLLIALELATEFGWLEKAAEQMARFCQPLGLPSQAALPLVAGLLIGFTYSAGVILASVKEGDWSEWELTQLWIFLGLTHALIEDTAIFAAMGLPVLALLAVRLVPTIIIILGLNHLFVWRKDRQ